MPASNSMRNVWSSSQSIRRRPGWRMMPPMPKALHCRPAALSAARSQASATRRPLPLIGTLSLGQSTTTLQEPIAMNVHTGSFRFSDDSLILAYVKDATFNQTAMNYTGKLELRNTAYDAGALVPDLDGQTDAFRDAVDGDAPNNALILVTTGGNDIRDLAPTGSDPVPQADAYEELQRCADELYEELAKLIEEDGVDNLVVTGIADVGLIPRYDRDGDGVRG